MVIYNFAPFPIVDPKAVLPFQVEARTGSFQLHLATPPPEDAIIVYRFINGGWMAWQYFAKKCEGLGLPNNGYPTTPDGVQCIRYEPKLQSIDLETIYNFLR